MAPMSKPTIKKHNCQEEGHIACGTYNPSPTTMKECPLCGSLIDRKALFHDCEAFKRKKVNPV